MSVVIKSVVRVGRLLPEEDVGNDVRAGRMLLGTMWAAFVRSVRAFVRSVGYTL